MAEDERLVEIRMMGLDFSFYTDASDVELEETVALVQDLVGVEPDENVGTIPMGKIAILACLNIASRHVRLQREFDQYRKDFENRLSNLSNEIRTLIAER